MKPSPPVIKAFVTIRIPDRCFRHDNPPLEAIRFGLHDYGSGLNLESLSVVADFVVDGVLAGQNVATKFKPAAPGVWEWKLSQPLMVKKGKLTVSVKDKQGNVTRIERTFAAGP